MNRQLLRKRDHYSSFQKKSNKFFSHPVSSRNCAILNEIMEIMENWCGKMALRFLWHGAYVVQLSGFRFPCIPPNRHCLLYIYLFFQDCFKWNVAYQSLFKTKHLHLMTQHEAIQVLTNFHISSLSGVLQKQRANTTIPQQEEASFAAAVASNCVKELIQYVFI